MADDKTTKDDEGKGKEKAKGADLRQPTLVSVEEHIANARAYHGEPSHVIAGAVEALIARGTVKRGDDLSSEQIRAGIKLFNDHEIQTDEGAQG
jgi:hypothetical protein